MELVSVICKAHFEDTRIGAVSRKQVVRVPVHVAQELASLDLVEIRDPLPAVSQKRPEPEVDGGVEPHISSLAEEVFPTETVSLSRRGRRKKEVE